MSGRKCSLMAIRNSKKGIFLFEFLVGLFLFFICLSIVWGGFLHALKNYEAGLRKHKQVMYLSQMLEVGEKNGAFFDCSKDFLVKKTIKRGFLEAADQAFTFEEFALHSNKEEG